jgi:hypothetical protein
MKLLFYRVYQGLKLPKRVLNLNKPVSQIIVFLFKKQPAYILAGFCLTAHSSNLLGGQAEMIPLNVFQIIQGPKFHSHRPILNFAPRGKL